jgi:ubiquinone/menaquinone biosynthesis C-methylase UbiE
MDPTARFSDRVADYVATRPGYPDELLRTLESATGLGPGATVADLGSGTGISARLLLRSGARVIGVEPNEAMRRAAEKALGDEPRFESVSGTAEATTLADGSVDLVTAAQAFHWFDRDATRAEMERVLVPGGRVALFWNRRLTDSAPFLRAYEALLHEFGTDYAQVDHSQIGPRVLGEFFGGPYQSWEFPNHQVFDDEDLRRRLLSSSYTPPPGHPDHHPMLDALARLFAAHEDGGTVRFDYVTELFLGPLS